MAPYGLAFTAQRLTLGRLPLGRVLWVLGGRPLAPEAPAAYDALFAGLNDAFSGCGGVGLIGVARGGFVWRHLHESAAVQQRFLPHFDGGIRLYHTIPLPGSFAEYLARFRKKKRDNLRRQVRLLREHANGRLELRRCEAEADVLPLLEGVAEAAAGGPWAVEWQERARDSAALRRYADLADRGLLRAYLLRSDGVAAAALVAYQSGGVLSVMSTVYNLRLAALSPGTVLLHLAVQDLTEYQPVRLIDFGFGDLRHTNTATQASSEAATLLLLPKSVTNRARRAFHRAFQCSVGLVKRGFRLWGRR
jgi:hypothetical protein